MKELKELKFEELSIDQKLGMVMAGIIRPIRCEDKYETFEENLDFVINLIKNHALGAVWVPPLVLKMRPDCNIMERIKEAADYPILIFTDAESGFGNYRIGEHNAIAMVGTEEAAYIFGKVSALGAKKAGYNIICDPVLDMYKDWAACGGNTRSMGGDKHQVAKLAIAEARGIHDAGVLSVAKHYPGAKVDIDNHMAPGYAKETKEELLDYNLYPYLQLMKEGLLDGIMTGHIQVKAVDPDYPTSVSKKTIDIIREQGFDGIAITDALDMMGLKAAFGDTNSKGMCIQAGNEFILPWFSSVKGYADLQECYKNGIITDERLDEAVRRVLEAQHKVLVAESKFEDITNEDIEKFEAINRDSVYARIDKGIETSISRDGKHFFVMIVRNDTDIADDGKVSVDTFTSNWYFPARITKNIERLFPNSTVRAISQFPTPNQNMDVLQDSLGYDDIIFITYSDCPAYAGSDHLTRRIVALINALQVTDRISTLVHFGNPFVLEELAHIPRILIGTLSEKNTEATLDVLAGNYPAKGKLTYDVNFQ